ncbi:MAG: response regulator [Acidimicrobiia bacterium]|nr:response regulator [Acidimicrobiia bacterium]
MMWTNTCDSSARLSEGRIASQAAQSTQKVVIVNGGDEVAGFLDTIIEAGPYDVVFVESAAHAYSQVKKVEPNLIILCLDLNGDDGFRVLSMLKLDPDTCEIPLLTYATGADHTPVNPTQSSDDLVFTPSPTRRMN